jgi:hypothetical protein
VKYLTKGTIQSYLSIPQVKVQNLAALPMEAAVKPVHEFWTKLPSKASPDADAVEFYALNHCVAKIRAKYDPHEILPEWAQEVMERYVEVLASQSTRLYVYMLLIISREARHLNSTAAPWYRIWQTARRR